MVLAQFYIRAEKYDEAVAALQGLIDQEPDYRPGSRVVHPRYGEGKVLRSEGQGDGLKLTVSFSGHRPKKFLAKYANLQRG